LTLNSSAPWQGSNCIIPVAPNQKIRIAAQLTASTGSANLTIQWQYVDGSYATISSITIADPTSKTLVIPANVKGIRLWCEGNTVGTFTFANLSLQRVAPELPFGTPIPLFSQGWVIHSEAQVSPDGIILILNASAANKISYYHVPVTPLTEYTVTVDTTAIAPQNAVLNVRRVVNGLVELGSTYVTGSGRLTVTIRTNADTQQLRIQLYGDRAGTYTFRDVTMIRSQPANPYSNLVPLFSDSAWSRHANTTVSPDGLTLALNATGAFQSSTVVLPVAPLAPHTIAGSVTGAGGYIAVTYLNALGNTVSGGFDSTTKSYPYQFVPPANVTQVRITCTSTGAGAFTFANLKLQKVQPTFDPAKVRDFFAEQVTNGDFSQGATGWTNSAQTDFSGGKLTINATAAWQNSVQYIDVTPNTTYRLRGDVASLTTGQQAKMYLLDDATGLVVGTTQVSPVGGARQVDYAVAIGPSVRRVRLVCASGGAGTFTFDNISLKRKAP
jgi:hypothetical protein